MLIKAYRKDDELLQEIREVKKDVRGFHLWWLGQSGYLLQWQDKHLLIDPYLSDSLTEKYRQTDKPHIRMSELAIRPERLDFIDIVTSSHNHTDHLDGKTLIPLIRINPAITFIFPEANRAFVNRRIGQDRSFGIGLDSGQSHTVHGFTFTGIPAAHNELERDEKGRCKFLGYIIQIGDWTIYHSGDTLWHPEILAALQPFQPDLAILPINGNKPERRVAGNLNAEEAVRLAKTIGAGMVIPCHYDMFTFNTADPEEFRRMAEKEQMNYRILRIGEICSFSI